MKQTGKRLVRLLGLLLLALVAVVLGYVVYLQAHYYRIEDHLPLDAEAPQTAQLQTNTEYTALTYNVGFGAYGPDYSFFMDTGRMLDGTKTQGKYGKAISAQSVSDHTEGVISLLQTLSPDFCLLQEVDEDATRSYHINQRQLLADALPGYDRFWANNFHSVYLFYPLNDPHGAVQAGLDTFSRYAVNSAERRSYPVSNAFITKFTDLDRCFTVLRLPVENSEHELVLINSHMSAYDKGGTIREQQLKLLCSVLQEEYEKGNYVIVGGDFNHALYGTGHAFATQQEYPDWVQDMNASDLPEHFDFVAAENGFEVPTCRGADIPYTPGVNYATVVDGFLISDNIQATAENIDTQFAWSDHNPVLVKFSLVG